MKEVEKLDPNDPVRITILVHNGDEHEEWVESKLNEMQKWVDEIYWRALPTKTSTMYTIDTKARAFDQSDFRKFMFQVRLKFTDHVNIR